MNVEEIFGDFFIQYCEECNKDGLSFKVTSRDRAGDITSNPHAFPKNAIDITLKQNGNFAIRKEYNGLMKYMFHNWQFRAGLDNTDYVTVEGKHPNVHIHVDLGQNRPKDQDMPYFFIEDNGKWKYQITDAEQIK